MNQMVRLLASSMAACVLLMGGLLHAEDRLPADFGSAKELYQTYVFLAAKLDPLIVDFYAPQAQIEETLILRNGTRRVKKYSKEEYLKVFAQMLPVLAMQGEKYIFSEENFSWEGEKVRIRCQRYSSLRKYKRPLELLVGVDDNGRWKIFEEKSQIRIR